MKAGRSIFIFVIIIFFNTSLFSQWIYLNPLPTGENIINAEFINDNTGYISTITFSVYKTTDGGNTWSNTCLLNTDENRIYKTTNGGFNWFISATIGQFQVLWDCNFINQNTGYFIGGSKLYKTTNTGNSWFEIYNFVSNNILVVKFYNEKFGSVAGIASPPGGRNLYMTSDGGMSWSLNSSLHALNISYIDSSQVYIINDSSRTYRSTNGGSGWTPLGISGQSESPLLYFENSMTGYTSNSYPYGYSYLLKKTTNGGVNWYNAVQSVLKPTNIIEFTQNNLFSVGGAGFISVSEDKGMNWFLKNNSMIENIRSIYFRNENSGIVSGNKILRTENGGGSWDTVLNLDSIRILHLQSPDNLNLYAACSNGYFARSDDFGNTWTFLSTPDNVDYTNTMFVNNNTGFIFKYNSNSFYRTSNNGNSWTLVTALQNVKDVSFVNSNTGYAISGSANSLYKTTDSGISWNVSSTLPWNGQTLLNILFNDENTGFLSINYQCSQAGYCFAIYRTTNAGVTWEQTLVRNIYSGSGFKLQRTGNNIITAQYGNNGLKSADNGNTWRNIIFPYTTEVDIFFPAEQTGYMAGNNVIGKILNGGTVSVNNENTNLVREDFHLSQNYPNPFNPKTVIGYSLTGNRYVSLKVYDVLGKEIITLVNEKQNAGSYTVNFNGESFPSGIYFYRLEAGDFAESKRMILLK